jgi:hypothetical protein
MKQTNLLKYGTDFVSQNLKIAEKSNKNSYRSKEFIWPNETVTKVQGYEHFAIQILLDIGYKQEDIITSRTKISEIWYRDLNNKKHRYYCDIYIKSEHKIIEVKSK